MKTRITLLITSLAAFASFVHAASHKGSEELELLALIAGDYTYEYTEKGSDPTTGQIRFDLYADGQYLKIDETFDVNDPNSVGLIAIIGYDKIDGVFTWYRVFSNGGYDHGRGRLRNGTITYNITKTRLEPFGDDAWDGPGIKLRTKWTDFSEEGWSFIWEQSKDGGPWEQTATGHLKKK